MPSTYISAYHSPLSALLLVGLLLGINHSHAESSATPSIDNQQFNACLNTLEQSSKFSSVKDTFSQYRPQSGDPKVLESLDYQPEFTKEPWDYLASLVDKERVVDGISASERYAEVLTDIESKYGVNRYDILGVWGVESDFGTTLGKKDVIESLATLSCFGRRQSYFRGEYLSALKILKQGDIAPTDFKGSWAGAFGQTQFMPSTFLQLAQDFDGDGRKDLVNSQADALASTANFLKNSGYQSNQPWGYEVRLPTNTHVTSDRKNKHSIAHWRNLNITLPDGSPLPDSLPKAGLFLPAGKNGPAFLVGRNFDAFYAYNASENYALAIAHLSKRIEQKNTNVNFATPWPTDDPGLSRKESRDVQEALDRLGYDVGTVDGIIGDGTRRAIQQYQVDNGLEPNGKAGKKIHQQLMQSVAHLPKPIEAKDSIEAKTDNAASQAEESDISIVNDHSASKTMTAPESKTAPFYKNKTVLGIVIALLALLLGTLILKRKR